MRILRDGKREGARFQGVDCDGSCKVKVGLEDVRYIGVFVDELRGSG